MAQVTVEQLAEVVGASVDRLLTQMKDAGLPHSESEQAVSDEDKQANIAGVPEAQSRRIERGAQAHYVEAQNAEYAPGVGLAGQENCKRGSAQKAHLREARPRRAAGCRS